MDKKQKERAVKKMFEKLQNEHKTLTTQRARGKLAVAEIKGCNWLQKKVTELKLNPRQVKTSTKTGGRAGGASCTCYSGKHLARLCRVLTRQ
eukprot:COSAG06_NODE_1259_length_10075_cov_50.687049_10_plen_92_part_00